MPDSETLASPRRSALISALIHAAAIALILLSTSRYSPVAKLLPQRDTPIYTPRTPNISRGGGGQHSPLPLPKGLPPKPSPRVFAVPLSVIREIHPQLEMPPEVLGPATNMPVIDLSHRQPHRTGRPHVGGPGDGGGLGKSSRGTGGRR
jgi:hypothetical protein